MIAHPGRAQPRPLSRKERGTGGSRPEPPPQGVSCEVLDCSTANTTANCPNTAGSLVCVALDRGVIVTKGGRDYSPRPQIERLARSLGVSASLARSPANAQPPQLTADRWASVAALAAAGALPQTPRRLVPSCCTLGICCSVCRRGSARAIHPA